MDPTPSPLPPPPLPHPWGESTPWYPEINPIKYMYYFLGILVTTRALRARTPRMPEACTTHVASAVSYNSDLCCR